MGRSFLTVRPSFKPFVLPLAVIALSGAMLPVVRTASGATTYTISSLSQLANLGIPYGNSANRTKQAGTKFTSSTPGGMLHAAGTASSIGPVAGFTGTWARSVNGSGQIAGIATNASIAINAGNRAFYRSGGVNVLMPTLATTDYTHAHDINNAGVIVGISSLRA